MTSTEEYEAWLQSWYSIPIWGALDTRDVKVYDEMIRKRAVHSHNK